MAQVHNFSYGLINPALAYLTSCLGCFLGLQCTARARVTEGGARGRWLGAALGVFRWDSLPSLGRRRGLLPLAAGTVDGRLAGYRERVPPETSEDQRRALARQPEGGRP